MCVKFDGFVKIKDVFFLNGFIEKSRWQKSQIKNKIEKRKKQQQQNLSTTSEEQKKIYFKEKHFMLRLTLNQKKTKWRIKRRNKNKEKYIKI